MANLATRPLCEIDFELGAIDTVGQTPCGHRVIGNLAGGTVSGERLNGRVLPGGGDWGLFMPDGTLKVDGRTCLETDAGELIYAVYTGRWKIHPDLLARLSDPETSQGVSPDEYYLRINFLFETGMESLHWLNQLIAVGSGKKTARGIHYDVFEIC